jgi:hypothetical protein
MLGPDAAASQSPWGGGPLPGALSRLAIPQQAEAATTVS